MFKPLAHLLLVQIRCLYISSDADVHLSGTVCSLLETQQLEKNQSIHLDGLPTIPGQSELSSICVSHSAVAARPSVGELVYLHLAWPIYDLLGVASADTAGKDCIRLEWTSQIDSGGLVQYMAGHRIASHAPVAVRNGAKWREAKRVSTYHCSLSWVWWIGICFFWNARA